MQPTETLLKMGWATEDITPSGDASLFGQYYERISTYVESPLTVTACAIESVDDKTAGKTTEQAIMISIDLLWCTTAMQQALREKVQSRLPDFDVTKLFVFATHTHSAPEPAIAGEYGELVLKKMSDAAVSAWNKRKPSGFSNSLGYAVMGHNRRVQYDDGTTEMYGATDRADFIGLEGPSDASVDIIYCWDDKNQLNGIICNVPCPAQVTEAKYYVSADYWAEVRDGLKQAFPQPVFLLPQCGAAGDLSPRDLPRNYKLAGADMWDVDGARLLGKRLLTEILARYQDAKHNRRLNVVFKHTVTYVDIPLRKVSKEEYEKCAGIVGEILSREPATPDSPDTAWNRYLQEMRENEKILKHGPWDNKNSDYGVWRKRELALRQYHDQHKAPYRAELHILRLGELAIASNPFELFIDYGFMIKGRSKATQTMLVQLSCDYADYLPTKRAIEGGGYSGMSTMIGAEGGMILVNETVKLINDLFE